MNDDRADAELKLLRATAVSEYTLAFQRFMFGISAFSCMAAIGRIAAALISAQ